VSQVERLETEARDAIESAATREDLVQVRARFLGKKGSVAAILRGIGELDPAERGAVGAAANEAKQKIEGWVAERRAVLEQSGRASALAEHQLDVSLPGAGLPAGRLHPVTRVFRDVIEFFASMGFAVQEGPEVETDWNNFGALNFPDDHPARDIQDTFFVEGGTVLRTHTSPVQIRTMTGREPPFRFIAPGRVYRHDSDATHTPMFHQIEGFMVDDRTTLADLKGILHAFARHMFGPETQLRFRGHYFPFTEPSAEMDFSYQGGWMEWGGCGMIHPNVLRNCGIDPDRYQGWAFGMGIDRTAMDRFGVPDLRLMFEGDVRLLEHI
jgi:phenylalanyl-tRNA synthetase alpha chain